MNFKVKIQDGDVYINDDFVAQLCWDAEAVGSAVALWLKGYAKGYLEKECDRSGDCDGCIFQGKPERCEGCCRNFADGYKRDETERSK